MSNIINDKNNKISKYIKKTIKIFENMEQYILNAFDYEYSNEFVEDTNNVIKHIAFGYKSSNILKIELC